MRGMLARLVAYVGALALVAIVGVDLLGSMATRHRMSVLIRRARSNPARSVSHRLPEKQRPTRSSGIRAWPQGPADFGWPCEAAGPRAASAASEPAVLLAGGNELKLAEVFARAELKRGSCAAGRTAATWRIG